MHDQESLQEELTLTAKLEGYWKKTFLKSTCQGGITAHNINFLLNQTRTSWDKQESLCKSLREDNFCCLITSVNVCMYIMCIHYMYCIYIYLCICTTCIRILCHVHLNIHKGPAYLCLCSARVDSLVTSKMWWYSVDKTIPVVCKF